VLTVSVGDDATGAFIANAQVRLPALGKIARTGWDGEAHFTGLSKGTYRIQVRAIGYAPGDIDLPVKGDTAAALFRLQRTTLDTVRVVASVPARNLREFEARRTMGLGRFLTDSALRDEPSHSLQLVLAQRIPGLFVNGSGVVSGPSPNGGMCEVLMYLDGFKLLPDGRKDAPGPPVVDLEVIRLDDIGGVEVYSQASAPVQYRRSMGSYCKLILLWTKW